MFPSSQVLLQAACCFARCIRAGRCCD